MQNWKAWIELQNDRIKNSQGSLVKKEFSTLSPKKIPRAHLTQVLDLARRLQLNYFILRSLQPYVRPQVAPRSKSSALKQPAPSSLEIALYALALARIGAHTEAWSLLDPLENTDKQILFIKASALISQWNYRKAQFYLRQYLKHPEISEYQKLIGKLNLAASYLFLQKNSRAKNQLKVFAKFKNKYPLLVANSHELQAQLHLEEKNYASALEAAEKSLELLKSSGSAYSLFSEKWAIIAEALLKENDFRIWHRQNGCRQNSMVEPQIIRKWIEFEERCKMEGQSEIQRDLDLYKSFITQDQHLQARVILGTPFSYYRKRAEDLIGHSVWQDPLLISDKESDPEFIFNAKQNRLLQRGKNLKIKKQSLKIVSLLLQDLYRSLPLGELFDRLYPGEKFNIWNSPARVYKAIESARQTFAEKHLPLQIEIEKKAIRITFGSNFGVRYNEDEKSHPLDQEWQAVALWLQTENRRHFSRHDYMQAFALSRSLAIQRLNQFVALRHLKIEGQGNRRFYHLTSTKQRNGTSVIT